MAVVHEVAARLASALSLSLGTTLFRDELPETSVLAGVVRVTGGLETETGFGVLGSQFEWPALQVVFRGVPNDVDGPRDKAQLAHDDLAKVEAVTLTASGVSSAFYHFIHPQQPPFPLKKDEQGRRYYAVNVLVKKEPSA
jgi:hypothetical protein